MPQPSSTRAAPALLCLGFTVLLAGCSTTPRLDRQFGSSVAALRVQQSMHANAPVNRDPVAGMDGQAASAAYDSYQKSFSAPAPQPAAFTIGVGTRP